VSAVVGSTRSGRPAALRPSADRRVDVTSVQDAVHPNLAPDDFVDDPMVADP
jgi:hypothetical protein